MKYLIIYLVVSVIAVLFIGRFIHVGMTDMKREDHETSGEDEPENRDVSPDASDGKVAGQKNPR